MSGMIKPKFINEMSLSSNYYKEQDPYKIASSCNINLLELSRYAREHGKAVCDLTADEVKKFAIV